MDNQDEKAEEILDLSIRKMPINYFGYIVCLNLTFQHITVWTNTIKGQSLLYTFEINIYKA